VATRGRALAFVTFGFALGQAALPAGFVAISGAVGWQVAWVIAAVCVAAGIPLTWLLLMKERTPQAIATETAVQGMENRHWTRADALRHPLFWLVLPAMLASPAWGTALFFQQVHLTEVKGWTLAQFVALIPMFTAVMVASSLATGWLIDRVGTARVMLGFMLPFVAGFALLAAATTLVHAGVGMVLLAVGFALHNTLASAFWAEHYGTQHLGAIKSAAVAVMVLASAIGPGVTGVLIDAGLGFETQMALMSAWCGVAAVLAAMGLRLAARRSARATQVDV
jgi:predicted MFS family arabinose efflux permease